jgi:histidinol phosphatase-like enzyme
LLACLGGDFEPGSIRKRKKPRCHGLWLAHERFIALLGAEGARLDAAFYAWGHPDGIGPHFSGLSLRPQAKPLQFVRSGSAARSDLAGSWTVGDRLTDVAWAGAAGARPILIEN